MAGEFDVEDAGNRPLSKVLGVDGDGVFSHQTPLELIGGVQVPFKNVGATTYTFLIDDHGKILRFTNAAGCVVTLPANFPIGFSVTALQRGAAQVSFVNGTNATQASEDDLTKTRKLKAAVTAVVELNSDGVHAAWLLFGSMGA